MLTDKDIEAIIYQVLAAISVVASLAVILTGYSFPQMIRKSQLMHIIFFISLCDFFSSIVNMFGYPPAQSDLCIIQGFVSTFFFPASWIFTTIMVYQLRCLLIDKRLWLDVKWVHYIVWSLSFIITLSPLSELKYGEDDEYSNISPCNLYGQKDYLVIFGIGVFFGAFLICFLLMTYWSLQVRLHFLKEGITSTHRMFNIYTSTRLYPLGLIVSWLPIAIVAIINQFHNLSTPLKVMEICQFLSTQYGTFLALVFFSNSSEARYNWTLLIYGVDTRKDNSGNDDEYYVYPDEEKENYENLIDEDFDNEVRSIVSSQSSFKSNTLNGDLSLFDTLDDRLLH